MSVVQLPPIQVIEGQDTYFNARFMEGDRPVDFTGWSAEFVMGHDLRARGFWRSDVDLDAEGNVSLTIPADQTDAFCFNDRRMGSDAEGVFQITFTAPMPQFNEIWQGNIAVIGVLQ